MTEPTHNPPGEARRASCLRENFTSSSYGEGLETDRKAPRQLLTRRVSRQGHVFKSVKVRPGPIDSGPVAREAPLRESTAVKPSSNMLSKGECAKYPVVSRMNAEVASSHAVPVAEMVDNMRKQQVPIETSPMRRRSPAGYQRRQGTNEDVETGEALDVRRRNSAEEALAITVSGKCRCRHQGDGSGRSTVDGRAAKRARREGPGPVGMTLVEARQG
jgi:hypothetical protein